MEPFLNPSDRSFAVVAVLVVVSLVTIGVEDTNIAISIATLLSLHVYGTDVTRVGSSFRRYS